MLAAAIRHVVMPMHERLRGRSTMACYRELVRTQRWSLDALRELQVHKLRALLKHAYAKCPAYRQRIDDAGIDPGCADHEMLARLPTVSKDDMRHADATLTLTSGAPATSVRPPSRSLATDFCDPTVRGGLHRFTTGGSTGDPLVFFVDRRRQAADIAARVRSRRWFGVELGDRELYLWGAPMELSRQDRLRSLRDRLINHRLCSAFEMTAARMDQYLAAIKRFDPIHIFGYPSSLARLVRHARKRGASASHRALRAVFTTGEVCMTQDRSAIRDYFGVPVADGYGSREAGFIAHECPAGRMHVTMECAIVEIIDDAGKRVSDGETGEIVITNLDAFGMPFIRYRTGDLSRRLVEPCPCGMAHETLGPIEGRRGDAIRLPGGGIAHMLSAIYPLRECPQISRFRVIQRRDLSLDVQIVAPGSFRAEQQSDLSRRVARQFADRLAVRLHVVSEIEPDPSGKHRVVRVEATDTP